MNKLSVNQKEFDVVPIYMEDIDFSLKKDQKFELLHFSISKDEDEYLDKLIDMVTSRRIGGLQQTKHLN